MNSMIEFMSRELIGEKIDFISDNFYGFKIVDSGLKKEIEDSIQVMIEAVSQDVAAHGEFEDQMPRVIAYLLDTVVAQQITLKLQEKYIDSLDLEPTDE